MGIIVCEKGHRYNTDYNATCPYCAQEQNQGGSGWSEMDLSDVAGPGMDSGWASINPTSPAADWGGNAGAASMQGWNNPGSDGGSETKVLDESYNSGDPTKVIGVEPEPRAKADRSKLPVTGWLVCIEGADKGKDFELRGAKCTIGRNPNSSAILSDPRISREGFPALIVYDDHKSHKFYLVSGDASSHNNVELGGEILLGQRVINPYDEIRIEDTLLVFVPFCGEDFHWEEK